MDKNNKKYEENILVVKRATLLKDNPWTGIKSVCFDDLAQTIQTNKEFHPRGLMEENPEYKQIIPYMIFEFDNNYFLMQRDAKSNEQRLANRYTFGIGGHVRQEDLKNNSIIDWAQREFYEEINYNDPFSIEPIGLLNDDSNAVGQVHVGLVLLIKGTSNAISIKSELTNGKLIPLEEAMHFYKDMETWSQMVLMHLLDLKYGTEAKSCCCN